MEIAARRSAVSLTESVAIWNSARGGGPTSLPCGRVAHPLRFVQRVGLPESELHEILMFASPTTCVLSESTLKSCPRALSATTETSICTSSPAAAIAAKLGWPRLAAAICSGRFWNRSASGIGSWWVVGGGWPTLCGFGFGKGWGPQLWKDEISILIFRSGIKPWKHSLSFLNPTLRKPRRVGHLPLLTC